MRTHEIGTALEDKIFVSFVFEQEGEEALFTEAVLQPPRYQGHLVLIYLDLHSLWRRPDPHELAYQTFLTQSKGF